LSTAILFVIYIYRSRESKKNQKYLSILLVLQIVFLIPGVIILIYNIDVPEYYYSTYSLKKMLTVGLLILSKLVHLLIFTSLWSLIASKSKHLILNSVAGSASIIFFIIILTIAYTTFFTRTELDETYNSQYDVVVVLGAAVWSDNKPSPIFTGRIEKAAQIFRSGRVKMIQLTGGSAPGEISEARAAYDLLIELGVSADRLQFEEKTSTTSEQIRYIRKEIISGDGDLKIAVISDSFHLKRVLEMCSFYNVAARVIASDYQLNFEKLLFYKLRDSIGLLLFWIFAI
jgi:vancomycin permeability regulator SanA